MDQFTCCEPQNIPSHCFSNNDNAYKNGACEVWVGQEFLGSPHQRDVLAGMTLIFCAAKQVLRHIMRLVQETWLKIVPQKRTSICGWNVQSLFQKNLFWGLKCSFWGCVRGYKNPTKTLAAGTPRWPKSFWNIGSLQLTPIWKESVFCPKEWRN